MHTQNFLQLTITDVISAIRLLHSPVGVNTQRKSRSRWALALKAGGKTIYTCQGREVLSDGLHIAVLPKGCDYTWICTEPGECFLIEFDAIETGTQIVSVPVADNSPVQKTFAKIEKNLHAPDGQMECRYLLYGLLLFLASSVKKEYQPTAKQQMLNPAISYITTAYFDSDICNDYLASLCRVSTVYFRKTFERVYGVPPMRYLQNLRMEKAKSMLLSDFTSISQIAESVGYRSIYHFCKMFKQHTGLSPGEYARIYRK